MARFPVRLISIRPSIAFMQVRTLCFVLSVLLTIGSLGLLFTKGLHLGIDFTGGLVMEIRATQAVDVGAWRGALSVVIQEEYSLQTLDKPEDVLLRVSVSEGGAMQEKIADLQAFIQQNLDPAVEFRKVDYVGPQVGDELMQSGAIAMILSFLAICLYVWLRFEWQFSVGALLALLHDAILTLGFMSLMELEFNLSSVAAILTIIGYSVNDSVVIYDRVRENLRKYKKEPLPELINRSMNETLSRTILTVGTTFLAVLSVVVLGGDVLYSFSLSVLFGIVIGTYSSIFISAPVLIFMNLRKE